VTVFSGRIEIEVPAKSARLFVPVIRDGNTEYNAYKRVR
jgi:hypothetical protein